MVRTRFAPAASNHLSVRELQGALLNSLLARSRGGKFVVRIGDLDVVRGRVESIYRVLDDIRWLEMDWDEGPDVGGAYGPYLQSERWEFYHEALGRLSAAGRLYPCFCQGDGDRPARPGEGSREASEGDPCRDLASGAVARRLAREDPHVLRFRLERGGGIRFRDLLRGWIEARPEGMEDPMVRDREGRPSRLLVGAVDDAAMRITHLLRCETRLEWTLAETALREELGERGPRVGHFSPLIGSDGNLYCRRHGAFTAESFKRLGYLPQTLANYLVHLGWTKRGTGPKYDVRDLAGRFHLGGIRRKSLPFEFPDLNELSSAYIVEENLDHLTDRVLPYLIEGRFLEEDYDRARLKRIVTAVRPYLQCLSEIVKYVDVFYGETVIEQRGREVLREESSARVLKLFRARLETRPALDEEGFREVVEGLSRETGLEGERVLTAIRVALGGVPQLPGIESIAAILGPRCCLEKVDRALQEVASCA